MCPRTRRCPAGPGPNLSDTGGVSDPAAYRLGDGAPVTFEAARAIWSVVAREALAETARRYNSTVAEVDLSRQLQQRSGVHTRSALGTWMPTVLADVAAGCVADGEPDLSTLCRRDGIVDDLHRAEERLRCYQRFATDLPDDGGRPTLLQRPVPDRPVRATRTTRQRTTAATPRRREAPPPAICPTCYMALPATGRCDTCS